MAKITTLEGFNRNVTVYLKQISSDPLIKLKKYDGLHTSLGPGLDQNGYPVTGLTENYKEGNKEIEGTRRALEKELDLPEGTLKPNSDFWASYFIRIGSQDVRMVLTDGHDMLKYLMAIAQSIVADGIKEIAKNSKSEFVIYSEEQEAEVRIRGRKSLKLAYNLAESLDMETRINILSVYGIIADASSPNSIIDKLDEYIENDPDEFLKIAKDGNLVFRSLVTKCLDKGVLSLKDGAVYHGEIVVGYDTDEAAKNIAKDTQLSTILRAKLSGDMDIISSVLTAKASK